LIYLPSRGCLAATLITTIATATAQSGLP